MGKNLHVIIGLPMRAMPNQEMRSKMVVFLLFLGMVMYAYENKTKEQ